VDGRVFERFDLDVRIGEVLIEPLENLESNDYVAFAGFGSQIFPSISREQQFAEKLHAYTLPRPEGRPNSRVKDLVDMNLRPLIFSQDFSETKNGRGSLRAGSPDCMAIR
jgi:hypothetical protein